MGVLQGAAELPVDVNVCQGPRGGLESASIDALIAEDGSPLFSRYRNRVAGFSILVPLGWSVSMDPGDNGMQATSPVSLQTGRPSQSITVLSYDFGTKVDLSLYYQIAILSLRTKIPNVRIAEEGETVICNLPARWAELMYPAEKGGEIGLLQYYILGHEGQKGYVISATSDAVHFGADRSLWDTIIGSFHEE